MFWKVIFEKPRGSYVVRAPGQMVFKAIAIPAAEKSCSLGAGVQLKRRGVQIPDGFEPNAFDKSCAETQGSRTCSRHGFAKD
jgi:hypothetical protein